MVEVCVVGELNLDLILYGLPSELATEHEYLAGGMKLTLGSSSAIFAHNLSVLGTKVGLIAKIGKDELGRIAKERLQQAQVDLSRMVYARNETPTGLTVVLPHGKQRHILTYPGTIAELEFGDLDLDYIFSARHLHVSSFFLQKALRPRMADLFREAKRAGLSTSLDTNDDPEDLWGPDLMELLKYVDVFLPNNREAQRIAGTQDLEAALSSLAKDARTVAIKCGAQPVLCQSGDMRFESLPTRVKAVDEIGAGDSFDAGFIHQWLRKATLPDCLAFANLAAAYSVTGEGGTEAFRNRNGWSQFLKQHGQKSCSGEPPGTNDETPAPSLKG
jgi:sugar/nucleoside kinase (ribokinase family)